LFADTEPLPRLPEGVTPGGARVLELQAACGFRAFAELRLWSTEPGSREPGLDARDRGTQVHKIMQAFWAAVRTQEALRGMSREERGGLLEECIAVGIGRAAGAARNPWEQAYVDVQRRRLRALLEPWLDFELTRPPFEVVQQEEKRHERIGPLELELRADRVDQTGGGLLVLDYKTGLAKPADWLTERPDAPQLPLYAVMAEPERVGGVAFALLRAGDELALTGYADSRDVLARPSRMPLPLSEQLAEWKRILTQLATAFAETDPIAGPKVYPKTCERCGQRILCRLDPSKLEELAEEDEAEVAID
jgi:RecB family exonuclease